MDPVTAVASDHSLATKAYVDAAAATAAPAEIVYEAVFETVNGATSYTLTHNLNQHFDTLRC